MTESISTPLVNSCSVNNKSKESNRSYFIVLLSLVFTIFNFEKFLSHVQLVTGIMVKGFIKTTLCRSTTIVSFQPIKPQIDSLEIPSGPSGSSDLGKCFKRLFQFLNLYLKYLKT